MDRAMNHWYSKGVVTGHLYNTTGYCYPYQFPPCDHHESGHHEPCGPTRHTPECEPKCMEGYNLTYKEDRHFAKDVYVVPSKM